jgi:hypothetical protein
MSARDELRGAEHGGAHRRGGAACSILAAHHETARETAGATSAGA